MSENKIVLQDLLRPETVTSELSEYWITLISKRWMIIMITVAATVFSTVHYARIPNFYQATADVLIENPPQVPTSSQGDMVTVVGGQTDDSYYGTQVEILTGPAVAAIVDKELGENAGYSISAEHKRDTRIISITANSGDPQTAARAANKYAEVYVQENAKEATYVSQQMLKWIPEDLEAFENEDEMAKLSEKFNKKEFAESLASVAQDSVIMKMRADKLDVESKLQEYSLRYKPNHPIMVQLRERLRYVESQLRERTKTILDNVRANLAGEITVTSARILRQAETPGSPAGPDRPRGILMGTLIGFIAAVWIAILSEEINQKVRTEKDLNSAGRLAFLGYVPLAQELLRPKKGSKAQRLGPPLPHVSIVDVLRRNSVLADAVASVRTRILFSVPYEKSKRIMITSAIPDEGKSTVAALLAYSLTGLGRKILLIDADMRKPFVHTTFNIPNQKGLTDYLVGQASYEEIVRDVEGGQLKVITGGSPTSNPSEILSSERLKELLERAQGDFDRVVIDVPPVLYIPDGLVVAKHVHVGVLVCGSGMPHKKTVREIKEKFDAIGYSFIGAVINRADYENEGYRYKYFNTYKKYYKHRTDLHSHAS